MAKILTTPRVWKLTRAGEIDSNPTTILQRAATFVSTAPAGSVLLTRRTSEGLAHYFLAPDTPQVELAAKHLAQTVAARAEEIEGEPGLFDSAKIAFAEARAGHSIGRDSQVGAELSEVSRRVADALRQGEWVATVFRAPRGREADRYRLWLGAQLGGSSMPTHHTSSPSAVVMSLWAGAETTGSAKALLNQVAALIPGFDVQITTRGVTPVGRGLIAIAVGLVTFLGGIYLFASGVPFLTRAIAVVFGIITGLGIPTMVGGVLYIIGKIPSFSEKVKRLARYNLLIQPRGRFLKPASPRAQHTTKEGVIVPGKEGSYPLGPGSFLAGPALPVGLIAPHAGADSGSATTKLRVAPAAMLEPIGPYIGNNAGSKVYLSAEDAYAGVIAFGQAGSGKSRLIQGLFAWNALEQKCPSGRPGFPGYQNTLIAFESKGEGAEAYKTWATEVGRSLLRIDFAGTGEYQLDILSIPGNAEKRSRAVVNMLKYAFSDGSIQERSFDTLTQVMAGAFAITPEVAEKAGVSATASPFYYASILLGSKGDAVGIALAGAIKDEVARNNLQLDTDLGYANDVLAVLYAGKTPAQRAQLTDAPRNKISALLAAESWWSRPRPITWDKVLRGKFHVVVNTGLSQDGMEADDAIVAQVSAMMMYSLYEAIKRNCSGWFEQGRGVSIFADELKLLAGSSSEVITWLRDAGRSYGVRLNFATQYPEQLAPEVKNAVMGFGTLLAFSQNNPDVIRTLIADLNLAGEEWTGADVANLPKYETIVRATAGGRRQAPFTVKVHDFWGDRENFAALQGNLLIEYPGE